MDGGSLPGKLKAETRKKMKVSSFYGLRWGPTLMKGGRSLGLHH